MVPLHPASRLVALSILIMTVFAGCISSADDHQDEGLPVDPMAGFVDPMAFVEGHDHTDRAAHQLSWNMQELGHTEMVEDLSVAWGEIDVKDGLAVVAHAYPTAGFATVDISNASAPLVLDHYDTGVGYGADVKLSTDGRLAVLAVQDHGDPSPLAAPDLLAGTVDAGIHLFDVSDPTDIRFLSAVPVQPSGVHMVYVARIDGADHVFAAHNLEGVAIYRIERPADGQAFLRHVNTIVDIKTEGGTLPVRSAHDMTVIHDGRLDMPVLYVADAYSGVAIYDVTSPTRPVALGHWQDEGGSWYTHTVQAMLDAEGRRIMVVVPEVFSDAEAHVVAPLWVLDATDFSAIRLLATWNAPGDHGAELLRFSVHNIQLFDGLVALAHYHAGVWLLDVDAYPTDAEAQGNASAALAEVTPLGYHLPANEPSWPMSGIYHGVYNMGDAPTVWDVVVHEGVMWVTDVNSGLYAVGHEALGTQHTSIG